MWVYILLLRIDLLWTFSLMTINEYLLNFGYWFVKVGHSSTTVPHYCDCSQMTLSFLESELLFVLPLKKRMKFLCASFRTIRFPKHFQQFGQEEDLWLDVVFLLLSFPPNKTHPNEDWIAMSSCSFPVLISLYQCHCGKSVPINIAASLSPIKVKSRSCKCW